MSFVNINARDAHGWTLLHRAIEKGDLPEVKRLLAAGADANVLRTDVFGDSPLHSATSLEMVEQLLENNAHINAENSFGETPLIYALFNGCVSIFEYLAFKGAKVDKRTHRGATPMFLAAMRGELNFIGILCAFDLDSLEMVDESEMTTPLMAAVQYSRVESVRLLLELNVNAAKTGHCVANCTLATTNAINQLLFEHSKKSSMKREQTRQETLNQFRTKLGIRLMRYAQPEIVNICLAFASLELRPYVLILIIDWLPNYHLLSHLKKIRLITSIRNSILKIKKIEDC